jgi:hypothetical protein
MEFHHEKPKVSCLFFKYVFETSWEWLWQFLYIKLDKIVEEGQLKQASLAELFHQILNTRRSNLEWTKQFIFCSTF